MKKSKLFNCFNHAHQKHPWGIDMKPAAVFAAASLLAFGVTCGVDACHARTPKTEVDTLTNDVTTEQPTDTYTYGLDEQKDKQMLIELLNNM